ncbi:copper chaperone PCu(A)C [Magnetovirga frankeli]|uniref:copper chaperone PCu(A)C n=1 Tax=Magnetovirga frankeli TaxID=947516 RepID=UPI001293A429|nr:copper chaperone PCu(A)C [gamma proteobacterium SS-5]
MIHQARQLSVSALLLLASGGLLAESAIGIDNPYVRAVPPGTPNSAAFMTINNRGSADNALVGAASPASKVVELHTHVMEDGMMKMRQVQQIDLPAGKAAVLEPGGLHIMLIGLKGNLKPGEQVDLTLKFADGAEQKLSAPVKSPMGMKMR